MENSKQASAKVPGARKTPAKKRRASGPVKKKSVDPKILARPLSTLTLNNLIGIGILTVEGNKNTRGKEIVSVHVNLSEKDIVRITKAVEKIIHPIK
jgi:hypothetical protein